MNTNVMLSPCPFCGNGAQIVHSYRVKPEDKKILGGCWIRCAGRSCFCEVGRGAWDSQEKDNGVFDTFEEAARAWNARSDALDAPAVAEIFLED